MLSDSTLLKLLLSALIFIFGLCGVLTPRLMDPFGTKISYANLTACGVIISAALVHLLSDASESLATAPLPTASGGKAYPWAYFICGLSFILLFFFERILIHKLLHNHHHHGHTHAHDKHDDQKHVHDSVQERLPQGHKTHNHVHKHNHDHEHDAHIPLAAKCLPIAESSLLIDHHDHHHGVVKEHAHDMLVLLNQKNYMSAIVLLFGLGVHSILAGLALGASSVNSQTIAMGIAILSHKYLASFALGCPLFKSCKSFKITAMIAIFFSLLTPIGIVVGLLLKHTFGKDEWISDLLVCIAAGTFLYIAICEIMIPEFSEAKKIENKLYQSISAVDKDCHDTACDADKCKPKQYDDEEWKKMLCVLAGFGIMSTLAIWL